MLASHCQLGYARETEHLPYQTAHDAQSEQAEKKRLTQCNPLFMDGEQTVSSGDTWLVAQQEVDEELARRRAEAIKRQGFWKVMWPSIVAMLLAMGAWIILIRIF